MCVLLHHLVNLSKVQPNTANASPGQSCSVKIVEPFRSPGPSYNEDSDPVTPY